MNGTPNGFSYTTHGSQIVISHHGRRATVLRGAAANRFRADIAAAGDEEGGDQQVMARITGNYKHGNERVARSHPRNRR